MSLEVAGVALTPESSTKSRETYSQAKNGKLITRFVESDGGRESISRMRVPEGWDFNGNLHNDFDQLYLRLKRRPRSSQKAIEVRTVDLFSGCGGLSLGAWEACRALVLRFNPVLAVDDDGAVLGVYKRNFKGVKAKRADLEEIIDGEVGSKETTQETKVLKQIGTIDLLLSGPPCQGHSSLNNSTRRRDDRNALYERVVRFAEISNPTHILIENVPQIRLDKGEVLQRSVKGLKKLGYAVSHDIVDVSTIGAPQRRKRHILVASRKKSLKVSEVVAKSRTKDVRDLSWAIGDLEDAKLASTLNTPTRLSEENEGRVKHMFDNGLYDLPNKHRPKCHQKDHSYVSMYGRLRFNEPAPTITTGFTSPGQGRYVHPTKQRTITPHEAARIQLFPDFFDFASASTRDSLKKMIGNAVPMKLAYVFALELLA